MPLSESVADVRELDTRAARNAMTVVGEQLVQELAGWPASIWRRSPQPGGGMCRDPQLLRPGRGPRHDGASGRHPRRSLGEKLRAGGLAADHVTVFFHTSEHDHDRPQRSVSTVVTLPEASNDTLVLVKAATFGVRNVWRDGFRYSKVGIVTADLVPLAASQRAFPGLEQLDCEHGATVMQALDACNRNFGRGAVVPCAGGFAPKREWSTKFEMRSPRYTITVDEIPVVLAA